MHWPSILLYMASSFMIIVFNKIILSVFAFESVAFIMFCQSLFTVVICAVTAGVNIQKPGIDIVWICILNTFNVWAGISSAGRLNVAMFTALRRFAILFTMIGQSYVLSVPIKRRIFVCVLLMIFGSLIAAFHDLSFDINSYASIMFNNLMTAASNIQKKRTFSWGWSKTSILFWSAMFRLMLTGIKLVHFDPGSFDYWDRPAFQVCFSLSVVLGFFINYGANWTVEKNDALTLSVAGSAKSAIMGLAVCIGLFDSSYRFTFWNFAGLQISAFGSLSYAYMSKRKFSPGPVQVV